MKKIVLSLVGLYLAYLLAVPVFLNTRLLQIAVGTTDETETHFKFKGAWSLFPGHINASELLVAVRDHNVKVDVRAHDIKGWLSVRPLFNKEVWIHKLTGHNTEITADLKDELDAAKHHAMHSTAQDQLELSTPQLTKLEGKIWKIMVPDLDVGVTSIRFKTKVFKGKMHAKGGFYFQPGVFAEILPLQVRITESVVEDELTNLDVEGFVQFKRFSIPETGGSEVFDYVNADLSASATATNLDLLNVTLRALPGYRFQDGNGNIVSRFVVNDGQIMKGSFARVDRSEIDFASPSFQVKGQGVVNWKVLEDKKNAGISKLSAELFKPKVKIELGKSGRATGAVKYVKATAKLFGLRMRTAFHGLHALIAMDKAKLSAFDTNPKGISWSVEARANGQLGAVAGEAPDYPQTHHLEISVDKSKIDLNSPKIVFEPKGTFTLQSQSVDFRAGEVDFGNIMAQLTLNYGKDKVTQVRLENPKANRLLPRGNGGTGRWRGEAKLEITGFDNLLEAIKEPIGMPDIAYTLAKAEKVNADFEWEVSDDMFLLRAQKIESSGIWSAWGTYIAPANSEAFGALETKVLGLIPLGLRFPGGPKVFPSTNWYDKVFKTSSSVY